MCLHNALRRPWCTSLCSLQRLRLQPSASDRQHQAGSPAHVLDACAPGSACIAKPSAQLRTTPAIACSSGVLHADACRSCWGFVGSGCVAVLMQGAVARAYWKRPIEEGLTPGGLLSEAHGITKAHLESDLAPGGLAVQLAWHSRHKWALDR